MKKNFTRVQLTFSSTNLMNDAYMQDENNTFAWVRRHVK